MGNKTPNTNTKPKKEENKMINSIIDICYNGLVALDVANDIKLRNATIDKNYFMTSLDYYYLSGETIPSYTDNMGNERGSATIEKPMKQKDIATLVDRHKGTISRQIKAMKYIIENGYFKDFYSEKYTFNFDKINLIFDEDNKALLENYTLDSLLNLPFATLKDITIKKEEEEKTDSNSETKEEEKTDSNSENATSDETVETDEVTLEIATLIYNDKEYKVDKVAFEKWLSENTIISE